MRLLTSQEAKRFFSPSEFKKFEEDIEKGNHTGPYYMIQEPEFQLDAPVEMTGLNIYSDQSPGDKGTIDHYYLEHDTMFYAVRLESVKELRAFRACDLKTGINLEDPNPQIRWSKDPDLRIKKIVGRSMILVDDEGDEFEEPLDLNEKEWKSFEDRVQKSS